ncbi:MAG: HNH endonuclease signature motif containing protein, partial [Candidatus Saccharimonadales bacterium]
MHGLIEGFPKPTACAVTTYHVPRVTRFVLHHIQPKEAGGPTVTENLVGVCDGCHYTIHRIMFALACNKLGKPVPPDYQNALDNPPRRAQLALAQQGFDACVAAGTV